MVLGVAGGIACYKAVELVRLLVKAEFKVQVIMTRGAMEFVTPLTFQTLSGNPVATEIFNLTQESEIGHINLADAADIRTPAPARTVLLARRDAVDRAAPGGDRAGAQGLAPHARDRLHAGECAAHTHGGADTRRLHARSLPQVPGR